MIDLLKKSFPLLYDTNLQEEIVNNSKLLGVEAGTPIIEIGNYIKSIPLVVEGSIKIMREDSDGNELYLYSINAGETCAMSLVCCMSNKKSTVRAVAEENSSMFLLPVEFMDKWMQQYLCWRTFVMSTYRNRFEELLNTLDGIAFTKLDERLEKYIINRVKQTGDNVLKITHQEIAYELNSSREVISRLLKQLEKKGDIQLSRNRITYLLDVD